MKKYIIYDIDQNLYWVEELTLNWSPDVKIATLYNTITEARVNLFKTGFPPGFYEIKEIFIRS